MTRDASVGEPFEGYLGGDVGGADAEVKALGGNRCSL
jgi:hypothetical protein